MRAVDLIHKKREGNTLTADEIHFLLSGYLAGDIPDYQMSAFLMAIYFQSMEAEELFHFTETMMSSGDRIAIPPSNQFVIDKHSTGGVGDKTTIALMPILAALDMTTAKLSGRGLGHSGGTIDKLESIPGFQFATTQAVFTEQIQQTGIGIMGYTDQIVPLDKMLYALRDVTATVESIPLIASSIMSKKLVIPADGMILDVKVGSGAFMKHLDQARALANSMLAIGKRFDRKMVCVLSNMDQPLGNTIGNALEMIEAIEFLKGRGTPDFTELIHTLGAIALILKGDITDLKTGTSIIQNMIGTGKPLEMFQKFIAGCAGDPNVITDYSLLPQSRHQVIFYAPQTGYITQIEAEAIGKAAVILGAGRATKTDTIDHAVGIILHQKVGSSIEAGTPLAEIHYNHDRHLEAAMALIKQAIVISQHPVEATSVILEMLW